MKAVLLALIAKLAWPPKIGLATIALLASIVGAAVLTGLLARVIHILEKAAQWAGIVNVAYGLLAGIIAVLLSLGLAINRRSIKLTRDGVELEGGEE